MTENYLPVHIAYVKEINIRKHALSPQKTVRGNVITWVSERTVDKFNIPTFRGDIPMATEKKSFVRRLKDESVTVTGHTRTVVGINRFSRSVRLIWNKERYLIKFPRFFTIPMIRDSLYLLLKANLEETKFMVHPSQKLRGIFIGNQDMVQVFLGNGTQLAASSNREFHEWGEPCLVSPPIRRTRKPKLLAS